MLKILAFFILFDKFLSVFLISLRSRGQPADQERCLVDCDRFGTIDQNVDAFFSKHLFKGNPFFLEQMAFMVAGAVIDRRDLEQLIAQVHQDLQIVVV